MIKGGGGSFLPEIGNCLAHSSKAGALTAQTAPGRKLGPRHHEQPDRLEPRALERTWASDSQRNGKPQQVSEQRDHIIRLRLNRITRPSVQKTDSGRRGHFNFQVIFF